MNQPNPGLSEQTAVRYAAKYLEAGEPQQALALLRGVRGQPAPPQTAATDSQERQRLRSFIERAILEIEVRYPGHALRTLRVAVGRDPLG